MTDRRIGTKPARAPRGAARRTAICEAVLDLAAAGGSRAVSHPAIDTHLGLPRGSTSYYYRTRRDLLDAAILHLTDTSRNAFHTSLGQEQHFGAETAAELIAGQLDLLLGPRRRDVVARYALAIDSDLDENLRTALAGCLFSLSAAQSLMTELGAPDPLRAAHNLISLLEGLLYDRLYGTRSLTGIEAGTAAGRDDLRPVIHLWLSTLSGPILG